MDKPVQYEQVVFSASFKKEALKKALALTKQGSGLFERMSFRHSRKLLLVKQFVNELNSFSLRSLTAYPKCFRAGLVHFPHTDDYINTPRKDFSYRFPVVSPTHSVEDL